jgi:hypothetical protein
MLSTRRELTKEDARWRSVAARLPFGRRFTRDEAEDQPTPGASSVDPA